jgi:hypothetical protein
MRHMPVCCQYLAYDQDRRPYLIVTCNDAEPCRSVEGAVLAGSYKVDGCKDCPIGVTEAGEKEPKPPKPPKEPKPEGSQKKP